MAGKIQKILVGTALDESSDAVVRVGVEAARAAGAQVHLAHAFAPALVDPSVWGLDFGTNEYVKSEEGRLRAALAAQAERFAAGNGWSLDPGAPHQVLREIAERVDADLVVVGAHTGPGGRLLGSTADRVIRKSRVPVLVVRGEPRLPFTRVLAPVDLSPLSAEGFRRGLEVVAAVSGDGPFPLVEALLVLSVLQRQVAPQFTPEQIDRFAAEELERFVTAHAGKARERVERKVRTGNVREEILAETAEWRPDLVAVGTHGLGGFDRVVIGSVAADVVREAPCSVLVVPPAEK